MRVLAVGNFYPPHLLGGYEIIWRGAMRYLREQGHHGRVLTTDYRASDLGANAPEDPDVHRELRSYWHDHDWPRMGALERLMLERHNAAAFDRHVRDFEPDVVAWWAMGGLSMGLIERARRARLPAVFFLLDYWPTYGPQRDLWTRAWATRPVAAKVVERVTGLPTRQDLTAARRWLFCSECVRDRTRAAGHPIAQSAILAPGIDRIFSEAPPELATPGWAWRLAYLGRVVEQKAVHTVIEALPQLPPSSTLSVVGAGDEGYRRRLEELTRGLGLADRVQFEPSRRGAELIDAYRAADAIVFPVAWDEPWGLVPLEAMALGRPVIATGRGGSGDYLVDGVNALLFAAEDADSLAEALVAIGNDPGLRERLRAGGYETAAGHGEEEFNRRALGELMDVAATAA